MNFTKVLKFLIKKFKFDFGLIGGLAISYYTKPRITQDLDFVILADNFKNAEEILIQNSYKLAFKTIDIATFISDDDELGRIDFVIAHRKQLIEMLRNSEKIEIFPGISIKILKPEYIIALKIQAYSNDNSRYFQDMADIENLLKCNECSDIKSVKNYFKMFNKEDDYNKLRKKLNLNDDE